MKKKSGFTLVEIIIIVVVLGILLALALPKFFQLHGNAHNNISIATAKVYEKGVQAAKAQWLMEGEPAEGIHYAKSHNLSLNLDPITKWPNAASINKNTDVSRNNINVSMNKYDINNRYGRADALSFTHENRVENLVCRNLMKVFISNASVEAADFSGANDGDDNSALCKKGKDWCAIEFLALEYRDSYSSLEGLMYQHGLKNSCLYMYMKNPLANQDRRIFAYNSNTGVVVSGKLSNLMDLVNTMYISNERVT